MRKRSVVPDTNVWAYIVEADAVERVRRAAKEAGVDIVACPAVLYECLRVKQPKLRKARMRAITRQCWSRPMPEAFLEAEDLRAEITRARPRWLASAPNLTKWWKLRADWQQGTWRRARAQTELMARAIDERRPNDLDRARAESKAARRQAQELGRTISSLRLDQAEAWYPQPVPGWDGKKFDAWRAGGEARWWGELVATPHPAMLDWLGPWLNFDYIRTHRSEWMTFWTREVLPEQLPREWIRWAMTEVQALKAVSSGTPGDNQIATYLTDFDTFVTADSGFAACVEILRPHAPRSLAATKVVNGGEKAVDDLLRIIATDAH